MTWEILEVDWGEKEGASPPAGKVFSTIFSIETGTEQITHERASCSQGAGIVHLMKNRGWGQREENFLPPPTRDS